MHRKPANSGVVRTFQGEINLIINFINTNIKTLINR